MLNWSKGGFVTRSVHFARPEQVTGYVAGSFGLYKRDIYWRLVHVPSGYEVDSRLHVRTLRQAKAVAADLEALTDWSRSRDEISATAGLLENVRNVTKPASE